MLSSGAEAGACAVCCCGSTVGTLHVCCSSAVELGGKSCRVEGAGTAGAGAGSTSAAGVVAAAGGAAAGVIRLFSAD